jgi:hypothetical protein
MKVIWTFSKKKKEREDAHGLPNLGLRFHGPCNTPDAAEFGHATRRM